MCTTVAVYSQHNWSHTVLYMWVWKHVHCTEYHIWERVQDEKKQEQQKCPAGTRQTDRKNWGLVGRNRKKISQIIKDYFHLPFFLLIILCSRRTIGIPKELSISFLLTAYLNLGCWCLCFSLVMQSIMYLFFAHSLTEGEGWGSMCKYPLLPASSVANLPKFRPCN